MIGNRVLLSKNLRHVIPQLFVYLIQRHHRFSNILVNDSRISQIKNAILPYHGRTADNINWRFKIPQTVELIHPIVW